VQIAQGRPADAVKTLSQATSLEPADPQLLAMAGAAAAQAGDFASANRYLGKALELQPQNAVARTELGVARLALGDTASAVAALEEASREDPSALHPEIALFIARFKEKDYGNAFEAAKRLQTAFPNEAVGFDFAGATYFAQDDKAAARTEFMRARALRPGDPTACRALATLAVGSGDLAAASAFYSEILGANPKDISAAIALADVEEQQAQRGTELATLQKAIEQGGDNAAPRIKLGQLYLAERKYQEAAATVEPFLANAPKDVGLLDIAGEAELALGNLGAAIGALKTLVELQPHTSASHRNLAAAYLAAGQLGLALAEARTAVDTEPSDPTAKMILARIDIVVGDYPAAQIALDELAAQYPKDSVIAELQGGISVEQDRPADAVAQFRRALDADDNATNRIALAVAQDRASQTEAAERTLLDWLATHSNDSAPRRALGDIYLAAGRIDDAQSQYEAILAATPDDATAENNLAWILTRKGETRAALGHAHHAASLALSTPQILDTLGVALLQNNQAPEAIESLTRASQILPTDPEIRFHFAQALVGAGDKDKARDLLRTLLAENPSFDDREAAQSLLRNLGG